MRRRAALGQINVVEKSIILKEDINATGRTGLPAIAPAAGKSWAMGQNQLPRFMIPAVCNAALALELHRSILMVIADLPSDIPAVTHKIIKAKWQFWQGCGALRCHSLLYHLLPGNQTRWLRLNPRARQSKRQPHAPNPRGHDPM